MHTFLKLLNDARDFFFIKEYINGELNLTTALLSIQFVILMVKSI